MDYLAYLVKEYVVCTRHENKLLVTQDPAYNHNCRCMVDVSNAEYY